MNICAWAAVFILAPSITAIASAEEYDFSTLNGEGLIEETVTMHKTHTYMRGKQKYSIGWSSGGAQWSVFHGCKGEGRSLEDEDLPGQYEFNECAVVSVGGDAGNWLNSPDGNFFYVQNIEFMGHRRFDLVNIDTLDVVPRLEVPSAPTTGEYSRFGPDPDYGEVGFSNQGNTLLAIMHYANRTELLVYDWTTPTTWAFRGSLPMEKTISGIYPVDSSRTLVWSYTGDMRLYDIENKKTIWVINTPVLADNNSSTLIKVAILSPNLQFGLLVSERGAVIFRLESGAIVATYAAESQDPPLLPCSEKHPDSIIDSLPRSPGRCGNFLVRNNGSALVPLQSGAIFQLGN